MTLIAYIYTVSPIIVLVLLCWQLNIDFSSRLVESIFWKVSSKLAIVFIGVMLLVSLFVKNGASLLPFEISRDLILVNYMVGSLCIIAISFLQLSKKTDENEN